MQDVESSNDESGLTVGMSSGSDNGPSDKLTFKDLNHLTMSEAQL